jgi:3-oxoacyl-[acyl-carrier-protein] synthase II
VRGEAGEGQATGVERRRVVVTGIGSVNPLAHAWGETWAKLVAGESGIARIAKYDAESLNLETIIAGEVKDFDPAKWMDAKAARRMDPFTQYAVAASVEAMAHARFEVNEANRDRIAVIYATGVGGLKTVVESETTRQQRGPRRVSPFCVPMLMPNAAAGHISLTLGIRGAGMAIGSACASSNDAIGMAMAAIRLGWADAVVTGGSEAALEPVAIAGFNQAGALSTKYNDAPTKASRPFDRDRDGFVFSEMGTTLILEDEAFARARGATILAELAGYGASMDSFHLTAPPPDGNGAVRAMRAAIADAGLDPEAIDYVSAHGTSTGPNDRTETLALKAVLGARAYQVPVTGLKSMTGHSAGGCGAIEAAAAVGALLDDILPPTINLDNPDPDCDLDYVPNVARRTRVNAVLSNGFGFGGHNSCLVIQRYV